MYGKSCGFGVRKDDHRKDDNGNIVMCQLVCSKEGTRNEKYLSELDRFKNPRPLTRTGCKAKLRVTYNSQSEIWGVSAFVSSHNHKLTPAESVHLIPNFRRMREADKALVDGLHSHGVKTCHILGFMLSQKGGHKYLEFCKKDLYNYIDSQKRGRVDDGDGFAALSYLQAKADNDPMFYATFTTYNGNLDKLFWSDGTSRIDYECFGDVVAFDTTYKKNKYNKPLVIFCGYNHHGGTTIFGSALVFDETEETYKWVLQDFLEAMYGKHPAGVVTDGDKQMKKAIRAVFPNSYHRLCSWHLQQNAAQKVKDPKFLTCFTSLIYANYTQERFETEWEKLLETYGLSDNEWVNKVYAKKKKWASAYMRETFFCGIRTTSMCEGINSFIKRYMENKSSLVYFLHNFERALKDYWHNELVSDFKSFYSELVLTSALHGYEQEASKIFTRKKFGEVKSEIDDVAALNVIERSELGSSVKLKIYRFKSPDYVVLVSIDKVHSNFVCDCGRFQRTGIPCSHIICAMKNEHIDKFPNSLISKRWTKSAKADVISTITSEESDNDKLSLLR